MSLIAVPPVELGFDADGRTVVEGVILRRRQIDDHGTTADENSPKIAEQGH
jgi:hypothetical protein